MVGWVQCGMRRVRVSLPLFLDRSAAGFVRRWASGQRMRRRKEKEIPKRKKPSFFFLFVTHKSVAASGFCLVLARACLLCFSFIISVLLFIRLRLLMLGCVCDDDDGSGG